MPMAHMWGWLRGYDTPLKYIYHGLKAVFFFLIRFVYNKSGIILK